MTDERDSTKYCEVQDIQFAVSKLSREELAEFEVWFEEYIADVWDKQFDEDVKAGRLDALAEQAMAEFRAGKYTEL